MSSQKPELSAAAKTSTSQVENQDRCGKRVLVMSPMPEGLIRLFFAGTLDKYKIDAEFKTVNEPASEEPKREFGHGDIIVGDNTLRVQITSETVDLMAEGRLIAQPSTGCDRVDFAPCSGETPPVTNMGGANAI